MHTLSLSNTQLQDLSASCKDQQFQFGLLIGMVGTLYVTLSLVFKLILFIFIYFYIDIIFLCIEYILQYL